MTDALPSAGSDFVQVDIFYDGVMYASLRSQEGVKFSDPAVVYSNGASGSISTTPYQYYSGFEIYLRSKNRRRPDIQLYSYL